VSINYNAAESKAQRFKMIAERRTNRVLDSLRLLGQCANRRTYEYSDAQVQKIFREIRRAVNESQEKFKHNREKARFKL